MKMILDSHWLIHYFLGESMGNIFFFGVSQIRKSKWWLGWISTPKTKPWKLLLSGEVGRGQKDQFLLECVWGPGHPVHPGPPGYILESYGIHVEKFRAENFHIVPIFAIFYNVCITCLSFSACGFCSKSIHRFSRFWRMPTDAKLRIAGVG